jgi:hypothetical protein
MSLRRVAVPPRSSRVPRAVRPMVFRSAALAAVVLAASCGSGASLPPPPRPSSADVAGPDVTPSFAPVSWILGDWQRDGSRGSEHWFAAAGALYGAGFSESGWEVMIIDDSAGAGPADGRLRFLAMPGGRPPVEFALSRSARQSATFSNPAHDFPTSITYSRDADRLRAVLDGPMTSAGDAIEPYAYHRIVAPSAPMLEDADRAFAKASAARGADAWAAIFEARGSLYRDGDGLLTGPDVIRTAMARTLARVHLAWEPTAGRLAFTNDIGITVGKYTATDPDTARVTGRGSYITVWRRQRDGSWKILFDTGRPENRP